MYQIHKKHVILRIFKGILSQKSKKYQKSFAVEHEVSDFFAFQLFFNFLFG